MSTLLSDLISIPEQVHKSDFVISLETGVTDPERTLDQYVVTPQLVECFDRALSLITSATTEGRSKGAYLHGSFGSGKSHFMAVLHLLLQGNARARAVPELGATLAKYRPQLDGRKYLLVPYHFIGMSSMEQAVLGGYVEHVSRLHPDAPPPAVYVSDGLIANAAENLERQGDEAFFRLFDTAVVDDGWGDDSAAWDRARFDQAVAAPPGSDLHNQLVAALVAGPFKAFMTAAADTGHGFVPLDKGLEAISKHAHDLGYHSVVLFLDELVLWLASRITDHEFVTREGQKVAKLVEGDAADRPAPIVSFIARQRDLRELVGEHVPGAEQLNFGDILRHWEGRFDLITLEDRNLVAIAERRILAPRSASARQQIDDAFDAALRRLDSDGSRATLLTETADLDMFRKVYPFNPALVDTLVALSAALQRERTALKVMVQLLSEQRDTLQLGSLVPLGDLFDVIATGDDPMMPAMRDQFEHAKRLWRTKFEPLLQRKHGSDATDAYRADARLAKTLLLAALVPEVVPLRNLTVSRLVALNHGSIRTFIPGTERQVALDRLREFSVEIGELRIGSDDRDPTVAVQLSGVDVTPILQSAGAEDNTGRRRQKLVDLLATAFDAKDPQSLDPTVDVLWRGFPRRVEVLFANVRDKVAVPNDMLRANGACRVVVDLPFDEVGYSPSDDRARAEEFRGSEPATPTVCWLPSFFTENTLSRLGDLVKVEHILSGDRLMSYTSHLSAVDREAAQRQLDGLRTSLRDQIGRALRQAYGIEPADPAVVQQTLPPSEQFLSLDPAVTVQPPVGAGLRQAMEHLVDQVLVQRFPAHPEFADRVTAGDLRTTLAEVRVAVTQPGLRHENVEQAHRRTLSRVAQPLKLGTMYQAHFVADTFWRDHFDRRLAQEAPSPLTVGDLRRWLDEPKPAGMSRELGDLVIAVYAAQTNRVVLAAGRPITPEIGKLDNVYELQVQALPTDDVWRRAVERGGEMFGLLGVSPMPSVQSVADLQARLTEVVRAHRADVAALENELGAACNRVGVDPLHSDRVRTAAAAATLLDELARRPDDTAETLAAAAVPTSAAALGTSVRQAGSVRTALREMNWELLGSVRGLSGDFGRDAEVIVTTVCDALVADELTIALAGRLATAEADATGLLSRAARASAPPAAPEPGSSGPVGTSPSAGGPVGDGAVDRPAGGVGAEPGAVPTMTRAEAERRLAELRDRLRREALLDLTWDIQELGS